VSLTISAIRGPSGEVVGASKVARDVTSERRALAILSRHHEERDRLLEAERAARAEAERASRAKDDFVALVSHELRTPLNAILGWVALIDRSPDEATLRRGLQVIARNTRVQAQLISDLLDINRVAAGKLSLDVERLDLRVVVAEAIDAVDSAEREHDIRFLREFPATPVLVDGDHARLEQVAWNLLANAVKFSHRGGRVWVRLTSGPHTSDFEVRDEGRGIRQEHLDYIFDRFAQVDEGTTRRAGGLGLGLALVRSLVDLHGGHVRANSPGEGGGASFIVTLPRANDREAQDAVADTSSLEDEDQLTGIRILLVEDDTDARDFTQRLLLGCGGTVTAVPSAAHALDVLAIDAFDILISDIGMPGVDGYQLIQDVRRRPACSQLPAIALTAYARASDRLRALREGYQFHLAKPFSSGELVAAVVALLALRRPVDRP
jgi:signal transduction histidine kinase/ActR/RegA family two-component response regulator